MISEKTFKASVLRPYVSLLTIGSKNSSSAENEEANCGLLNRQKIGSKFQI